MIQRLLLTGLVVAPLLLVLPGEGQAQYFGRNKVQYRAFDFKIIETEHFDIYFYEEEREAALDVARMAERAYARLSKILQHEFRDRKAIILYASHTDFQQTNTSPSFIDEGTGAFAEPLKNRVVIPLTGSYADFEHVLTHELVHLFQFDVIYRRGVVTDATPFGARPPLWFMEGMAEYLAIGRIDALTAAWVRDASLSGYLRSIAEMNRRDDYLSYRFGQSLWAYIGSKWGDEVIGILLQRAPRVGLERAFQSTLGLSLEELSNEWMAAVRSTYFTQVTEYQRPEQFAERLTHHARLEDPWFLAPSISPDGELMAFISQRDGFSFNLWLADAKTGQVKHKLIEAERDPDFESLRYMTSSASFSPDGRYLAFAAQMGGRDALYIMDLQRRKVIKRLRFDLNGITNPSWSPDGRRLVFTGLDGGLSDLFITDLDGNLKRLTRDRYADLHPSWSPDGRTIAFATDRGPNTDFDRLVFGNLRVALYHLDSEEIEVLPGQDEGKNLNPVWAPDSRSLVWVSDRTGTDNLYYYDLDQRELYRISDVLSGVIGITRLSPVLSWAHRDGRLLFIYFEEAGYNIYAVDDPRTLPRTAVSELRPEMVATAEPEPEPEVQAQPTDSATRIEPATETGPVASFYRLADGFRPSSQLPDNAAPAEGPVSVITLLDSADFALPDTANFRIRDYSVKFSPDIVGRPTIGAQVGGHYGNGIYGGSYIALSDMLGNHNILLAGNVNGSFSDAMFFAGYDFLKTRTNFGIAAEQVPLYRYLGADFFDIDLGGGRTERVVADVLLRDVIRTAQGLIAYPFSTFRRLELGASATYFKRDLMYRGQVLRTREPIQRDERLGDAWYFQPSAAIVFDNSLFGWTGPIYGRRYRAQVSRSLGDFEFSEAFVDFRNYLNWKRRVVLASRFVALSRFGGDSDRFALYWGGPYFIRGYDGDSFDVRSAECAESRFYGDGTSVSPCPVRDQLIGSSAAFMNLELRFPIITELQIGFLGNFPPVDAVLFFDGGVAWDNQICLQADFTRADECAPGQRQDVRVVWDRKPGQDPYLFREPLFSYGLGLRFNIFYTVLRLDYAFPVNRPDRSGVFSISFGPSF